MTEENVVQEEIERDSGTAPFDWSGSIDKLAGALAKAQGEFAGAKKDSANPHFKSKYADLASCWDACRDALSKNGLAVIQATMPNPKGVQVVTMLTHSSGQWVKGELFIPATKADAQGFGSALTYARRYALCALVGIAPEDDDGEAAVKSKPAPASAATEKKKESKPAAVPADAIAAIEGAKTVDELLALVPTFQKYTDEERVALRPLYNAKKDALAGEKK